MRYPLTTLTSGEYVYLAKQAPYLVEKLGPNLIETDEYHDMAMPAVFIFFGTDRQRKYFLRNHDINPKHLRSALDPSRLQGLRGRPWPIHFDPLWHPQGIDERIAMDAAMWTVRDMESKTGSFRDVQRFLHPEDEKKWIRLA